MKIHIFGASGSGTTTLGRALSEAINVPYFDTDDYYWEKTEPPFTQKVEIPVRQENILSDTKSHESWILGGSLISWGDFIKDSFDLVVFIYLDPTIRLQRLKKREFDRYGKVIFDDPLRHQQYLEFIEWASQYDNDGFSGRSKKNQLDWLSNLNCKKLKIEEDSTVSERVKLCLRAISEI